MILGVVDQLVEQGGGAQQVAISIFSACQAFGDFGDSGHMEPIVAAAFVLAGGAGSLFKMRPNLGAKGWHDSIPWRKCFLPILKGAEQTTSQ